MRDRLTPVLFFSEIGGSVVTGFGRRARTASLSFLAVAALVLTGCSDSGPKKDETVGAPMDAGLTASFDQAIANAMQYSGSDAAIVGVWSGDTEYLAAYGDNANVDSIIRGAQTTQPMLCALLLDLAADGTVPLDRKVSEDISRQVGIEDITYEQLCAGTSGLADFKQSLGDVFANNPTRPWVDRELFVQGLARSPLSWPGLDVHVSDTDALLLARALPVATGTPLTELLQERVFTPLGMTNSAYPLDLTTTTLEGDALIGLTYPSAGGAPVCEAGAVAVPKVSPAMLGGAGAISTTVVDLKDFYQAYIGGEFGKDSLSLITTTVPTVNPARDADGNPTEEIAVDPSAQQWGFGTERFGPLYGMSGSITGTLTASYYDPESDFTVVVVLNNSSTGANFVRRLAFEIAAIASEAGSGPAALGWTAADQSAALAASAICQAPAEEAPAEEPPAEG